MRITSQRLIKCVRNIPAAHMPVAGPTEIVGFYSMQPHIADQRGPYKKIILVEVACWAVVIVMKAELRRVPMVSSVLSKEVRDEHGLVAEVRRVQLAVGVLLEHIEVRHVELISVVRIVAEQTNAEVCVAEDEPPEVADERLYAGSNCGRVEIRVLPIVGSPTGEKRKDSGCVAKPDLAKGILQRNVAVGSRISSPKVNVDDPVFLSVEIVDVKNRCDVNSPIDGLERYVAVKQLECENEILIEEELTAPAEELFAVG